MPDWLSNWLNKWENFSFGVLIGWIGCNLVYLVAYNANPMTTAGTALAFVTFVVTFILRKHTENSAT